MFALLVLFVELLLRFIEVLVMLCLMLCACCIFPEIIYSLRDAHSLSPRMSTGTFWAMPRRFFDGERGRQNFTLNLSHHF